MNKEEIYKFCKKITEKEKIDFKYIQSESEEINLNRFSIENYYQNISERLFIRVIDKNSIGTYSIQDIRKEKILEGIKKAKEIAKLKKSTIKYTDFGDFKSKQKIKFDTKISEVKFSDILSKVKENLTKDKTVVGYIGGVSKVNLKSFYINNNTEKEEEKSYIFQETGVLTKNIKKSSGDFSSTYTRVEDIDINSNFLQAKINAQNLLDPEKGSKGEYTLILTPGVTKELISFILSGTTGDIIEKKKSFLHEHMGKQVFSKNLNIVEDPHIDYFLKSQTIDDEGIKTTQKEIIKEGVFTKPIYDLYSSIKYNKKATGNGFLSNNYSSSYTNIIQEAGSKKIEDVIDKTKKGVLVYQILGFHTNKMSDGNFALTISAGKEIINGKYVKTITNLNFSGNLKDILKEVYFSKEQQFFGSSLYSFTVLPNIKLI